MQKLFDFYNYLKFFISFYFTSIFNYKFNKVYDDKIYLNLQHKYLKKGELNHITDFEIKNKYSVNRKWLNKLALHTQVTIKKSEINYEHGKILYSSLSKYISAAKSNLKEYTIFETGTAKGFSSICLSKALIDQNAKGKILSIDVVPHNIKRYWNVIDDSKGKKTREELLSNWQNECKNIKFITGNISNIIKNLKLERINFAFIDSIHTPSQIKLEFRFIANKQKIGDIIILDDIDTSYDRYNLPRFRYLIEEFPNYNYEFIESFYPRCYAIAKKTS